MYHVLGAPNECRVVSQKCTHFRRRIEQRAALFWLINVPQSIAYFIYINIISGSFERGQHTASNENPDLSFGASIQMATTTPSDRHLTHTHTHSHTVALTRRHSLALCGQYRFGMCSSNYTKFHFLWLRAYVNTLTQYYLRVWLSPPRRSPRNPTQSLWTRPNRKVPNLRKWLSFAFLPTNPIYHYARI